MSKSEFLKLVTSPEIHALVPRPSNNEYESLKNSIKNEGQQEPIVIWSDSNSEKTFIIDGHTRFKICQELGLEPKVEFRIFESWLHAKKYAMDINLYRRQLSDYQKVELALRSIAIEDTLAAERKKTTFPVKGKKGFQPVSMPNGDNTGRVIEIIADKIGMSSRTVARLKRILDHGTDKLKQEVASGKTSPALAERMLKKEDIQRNPIQLPEGKYRVILCDVPFQYERELEGAPNYPTLPLEEIIHLKDKDGRPITSVFADDCVIFFWSPIPKLEESFKILDEWGFKYKTGMVWSKEKDGKPQEGTGYYVRATCELLLIATKGKIGTPLPKDRPLGIIKEPRTKIHSQKPERARYLIEKMYPGEKYLELFGREKIENWNVWGDQIDLPDVKNVQKEKKLDEF